MSTTETEPTTTEAVELPTLYIRFLRSGLTLAGAVRRIGHVLPVEPGHADYDFLTKTEQEQRQLWPTGAYWEHIDRTTYEVTAGLPSTAAPEPAPRVMTPAPPGVEGDIVRGAASDAQQPAPAAPGHVGPVAPDAAGVEAQAAARWPWYADADIEATLAHVANMSEPEAVSFLAWEQTHKARKGITGPMMGA